MPEAQAPVPAVDVRHLGRRFGSLAAVDDLTLAVRSGEIYGLLGTSILDTPAEVRQRIGDVPQMLSADGTLTGRKSLVSSARLYGIALGRLQIVTRSDRTRIRPQMRAATLFSLQ